MSELEVQRQRFESWFKMTYPMFGNVSSSGFRDTTLKHQLWTAWQLASLKSPVAKSGKEGE